MFPVTRITIEIVTGEDEAEDVAQAIYRKPFSGPLSLKTELRNRLVEIVTDFLANHDLDVDISAF